MGWLKCFLVILLAGCNAYFSSAAPTTTPHASSSSSPTGSTPSWRSSTSTPSCGSRFLICGEGSGLAVYEQGHCGDPLTSDDVQMSSLVFDSLIQTRYARTEVSSTVQNDAYSTRLFNFTFVIPEAAVVSTVSLTLNGVQYFSSPIKKEGQVINTPTSTSAGISVRDATQFGIRLALAARSTVVFSLTYEELLNRQASEYTHKVHISPGQVVPHLEVRMRITEPTEITSLDLKPFTNDVTSDSTIKASIIKWSGGEAEIQYVPTVTEQIQLAELFQDNPETGLNGYLAISYDVLSPAPGGQLFVHNYYFVHFFSPSLWTGIPKHALFVLDVSGSMSGVKIQQLKDALVSILNHLDAGDSFTVIEFSSSYKVWDLDGTDTLNCHTYQASSDRISAALSKARAMQAGGGTSLNAALLKALKCTSPQNKLDPILVVLTDGQATDASSSAILANVKAANVNNTNIFSLAFGQSADFNFLHSLAHGNGGKAHIIYEGKDAAQQLEDFYSSISTPLLMDVSFNYGDMVDASTKSQFHQYFRGSELVTAGRLKRSGGGMSARVTAKGPGNRNVQYSLQSSDVSVKYSWQDINGNTPIERLWASLALAQQLEDENYPATWTTVGPPTTRPSPPRSLKGSIRDSSSTLVATASPSDTTAMALQYSFVTPSTCIEVNTNVAPTTAAPSTRRPGTTARTSSTGSTSRPSSSTPQYSGTAAATASSMLVPMFCLLLLGV